MLGWILLFIFIAIALLLIIRGIYETFQLDVSFSILGEGDKTLRIVLFSDLHAKYFHVSKPKLLKAFLKYPVDAFLFAGDMTNNHVDQAKALEVLTFISQIAKQTETPFYSVPGNHDRYEINDKLSAIGIILLRNQSVVIKSKDGSDWQLVGLEDLKSGNPSYDMAINNLIDPDNSNDPFPYIVLAHNPDSIYLLPRDESQDLEKAAKATYHLKSDSIKDFGNILTYNSVHNSSKQNIINNNSFNNSYNNENISVDSISINNDNMENKITPADSTDLTKNIINNNEHKTYSSKNMSHNKRHISLLLKFINLHSSTNSPQNKPLPHPQFLLSGHLHGGQIWLPFDLEYRIFRNDTMSKLGFRKGAYHKGGITGYITRGLGCVLVPLRFLSYPELSFIELRVEK